jgi:hypothetical protein
MLCFRRYLQSRPNDKELESLNLISGQPLRQLADWRPTCKDSKRRAQVRLFTFTAYCHGK